ncbi:MAG: hypothetical protein K5675_05865 [Lachnospiraceae bacterium]|nr:hypothetical protein [Lachnospiraceae bacterium]
MSLLYDIREYIKSGETNEERLGLEIEHFIIDKSGRQILLHDLSPLIEEVANQLNAEIVTTDETVIGYITDDYAVSIEPSCQFEISINPYSEIEEIESIYDEFCLLWEPIFSKHGYEMVARGILPMVENGSITPGDIPLYGKKRYKYMDEYFETTGKYGKYMMRASASTQVSIDYKSEEDLVRKLRLLQKLSPIFMIMMESKNEEEVLSDTFEYPHLLRSQVWDDLDPKRTGFYPGAYQEDFGYRQIANTVYSTPLILLTDQGESVFVGDKSAKELEREGLIIDAAMDTQRKKSVVEHIFSMGFFHFRIKKFIEIRVADSVPIKKALGYVALIKGIVYSDLNMELLEKELKDVRDTDMIQDAIDRIKKDGLNAIVYHNRSAKKWINRLKTMTQRGLSESERRYLIYV